METRVSNIAVGIFVLALVVGAIGFVFWVGKYSEKVAMSDHYVRFAGSVAGLDVGSNVLFGGIPIGHVTGVAVDPVETSLARVDLSVDSSVPIRKDSQAVLAMQGITGGVLVEISRGTETSPKLAPGAEIRSGYSQLELLLSGAPQMIAKGNAFLDRATAFLSDDNAAAVAHTLRNIDTLTALLAADSGKFDTLLTQGTDTLRQLNTMSAEFQKLATDLRGTTGRLGAEADNTLAQIRVMSESFSRSSERFSQLLDDNRQPVRDFTSTGLYELTQMITEVRLLDQTMNRISIQIERDPARFFFGDRQKGFNAQ